MKQNLIKDIAALAKNDKKLMIIIFASIIGIILIVISPLANDEKKSNEENENISVFNELEYTKNLEEKLEEMISLINGAGESHVIVTLECDYETVYARDGSLSKDDKSTDEDSEYIIIDSQNSEDGLALKTVTPRVRGVAVVCSGGDNAYVISAVTQMMSAVLDIGTNHISVAKIK